MQKSNKLNQLCHCCERLFNHNDLRHVFLDDGEELDLCKSCHHDLAESTKERLLRFSMNEETRQERDEAQNMKNADTIESCGWGTDEDYGNCDGDDYY